MQELESKIKNVKKQTESMLKVSKEVQEKIKTNIQEKIMSNVLQIKSIQMFNNRCTYEDWNIKGRIGQL